MKFSAEVLWIVQAVGTKSFVEGNVDIDQCSNLTKS